MKTNSSYETLASLFSEDMIKLVKAGNSVEYQQGNEDYKGKPAKIIRMESTDDNGVNHKITTIVDIETHLPQHMISIREVSGQKTITNIIYEYPKVGPADIYQAGASQDAKVSVFGYKITPEFIETIQPYRDARDNLPKQRIVVDIENSKSSLVSITYTDGLKERVEQLRYAENDMLPDMNDFSTIFGWANKAMQEKFGSYKVQLNDGKDVYHVTHDYYNPVTSEKLPLSHSGVNLALTGLINRGWPEIQSGIFIQNDYALKNNLLCIENTEGPLFTGDSKIAEAAEKTLYYIDPKHDYICVRIEKYRHPVPPQFGNIKNDMPVIDPINIPSEPYLITEVVKFDRTNDGFWYPSQIITTNKQSWYNHNNSGWVMRENTTEIKLYIDTNPLFPDDIFNPETLPKAEK